MAPIGNSIVILESVESTNNYAMQKVHSGEAAHGDAWLALEQTAGKGQRGRVWNSEAGKNILFTTVLEPHFLPLANQVYLSMAIALACYDLFSSYAGDETRLKRPNDLYWRDRKAGGILMENVLKGESWEYAVVGIGININQVNFAEGIGKPVSLKQITGNEFDPLLLTKELCSFLEERYEQLKKDKEGILKEFERVERVERIDTT